MNMELNLNLTLAAL